MRTGISMFFGLISRAVTGAATEVGRLRPHRRGPVLARAGGVDGNEVKPGGIHEVSGAWGGRGRTAGCTPEPAEVSVRQHRSRPTAHELLPPAAFPLPCRAGTD